MFEVGFSKVSTYRSCPKKYYFAYVLNLQAKRRPVAMFRGTILHEMLEAHAKNGWVAGARKVLKRYEEEYAHLFEEEKEYYGENFLNEIERIMLGYIRTYDNDGWIVEATEEEVVTDLVKGIRFVGHIDRRVVSTRDDRRWLVDHKTKKTIPTAEERFGNFQLLLYVWAWNREHDHDEKVDGIIWDYLRTKAPTVPEPLKKGGLTQRADLDTDVWTYEKAIEDNKLDRADYAEYLEQLEKRSQDKFYCRVPLPAPHKETVNVVVEEFKQTAILMEGLKVYPRNMTVMCCKTCEFFRLCQAELTGVNAKFVLKSDYEEREEDDGTEED
jgi:RecB family exonuclease